MNPSRDGVVLIPSPLLPPDVWAPVADRLGELEVVVPALNVAGETSWRDHLRRIVASIEDAAAEVLQWHVVAHSGAGVLVGPVVDACGPQVASLIMVDAMLPKASASRFEMIADEGDDELAARLREHLDGGGLFPRWGDRTWARLVEDPAMRERLRANFVAHPGAYWDDVIATSVRWQSLPGLFVLCSDTYRIYYDQAGELGWQLAECDGGHLALVNRAPEIAAHIARSCREAGGS